MSKYCEEIVKKFEQATEIGVDIKTMCNITGITRTTWYGWFKNKSNFSDRIIKARQVN